TAKRVRRRRPDWRGSFCGARLGLIPAWDAAIDGARPQWRDSSNAGHDPAVPAICGRTREVTGQWRFEALIHGDIKWDNCVLCAGSNGASRLRVGGWGGAG